MLAVEHAECEDVCGYLRTAGLASLYVQSMMGITWHDAFDVNAIEGL
jgi:hypothetical protein